MADVQWTGGRAASYTLYKRMRLIRIISALVLCLALVVSPAVAGFAPAAPADGCCGEERSGGEAPRNECDSRTCVLPCCRPVPAQPDAISPLLRSTALVLDAPTLPTAQLDSVIDREAIFHPPRA